jgi:hypothetical protein
MIRVILIFVGFLSFHSIVSDGGRSVIEAESTALHFPFLNQEYNQMC